jgi:hypothetical protein
MDKDKFKDLIEAPANFAKSADVSAYESYGNAKQVFLRALVGRTVRITLQYPELAQEYSDNLPKVVNKNIPITKI